MKAILVGKVEYFLKRKNLLEKNVNLKEMILFEQGLTMCFNTFGTGWISCGDIHWWRMVYL